MDLRRAGLHLLTLLRGATGAVLAAFWAGVAVLVLVVAGGLIAYGFLGTALAIVLVALILQPSFEVLATVLALPGWDRALRGIVLLLAPQAAWVAWDGELALWPLGAGVVLVLYSAPRAYRRARSFREDPSRLSWRVRFVGASTAVGGAFLALFAGDRLPAGTSGRLVVAGMATLAVTGGLFVASHELLEQLAPTEAEEGPERPQPDRRGQWAARRERLRVMWRDLAQT